MTTYAERWGKPRTRTLKSDPRKQARRERAALRAAEHTCGPPCKRFRSGGVDWPDAQAIHRFVDDTVRRYGPALDRLGLA